MVVVPQEVQIMTSGWREEAEYSRMCWNSIQWLLAKYMYDQHMPRETWKKICQMSTFVYGIVY